MKKSKNNKPRKNAARNSRRPQQRRRPNRGKMPIPRQPRGDPSAVSSLVQEICSITDPFCHSAYGAKYPDNSSLRTLTEQIRTIYTPVVDGSGCLQILFPNNPAFPAAWYGSVDGNGNAWTPATAYGPSGSWETSICYQHGAEYRVVSWGVKLTNIQNAMESKGYAILGTTNDLKVPFTLPFGTTNFVENQMISLNPGFKDVHFIAKPASSVARAGYIPKNALTNTFDYDGTNSLIVQIFGTVPESTPLVVEIVYNLEFTIGQQEDTATYNPAYAIQKLATPSPPPNSLATQVSARVTSATNSIIQAGTTAVGNLIHSTASSLLGKALSYGSRLVGTYFGGPIGGQLASSATHMIMDVD